MAKQRLEKKTSFYAESTRPLKTHGREEDSILAHLQGGKNSLLTFPLIEKLLH